MTILLAIFRLLMIISVTLSTYLIYLSGLVLCSILQINTQPVRNGMVKIWATLAQRIIGMEKNIKGTLPEPPFYLVSNHLSYIDVIPYFTDLPAVFVAKSELREWPILGTMAKSINIIFIERERISDIPRVNNLIESNINKHQGVIVFPEGTTTNGKQVNRFNSSLLQYPVSENIPVSYASITYQTLDERYAAEDHICWWGDMTFIDHFFNLLKIRKFRVTISFGNEGIYGDDRKKLATMLHQKVNEQFVPVDIQPTPETA